MLFTGSLRVSHAGSYKLRNAVAGSRHLVAVCPEGIGIDNIGACCQITLMHACNLIGLRDVPHLGNPAERKAHGLQPRSHRAV